MILIDNKVSYWFFASLREHPFFFGSSFTRRETGCSRRLANFFFFLGEGEGE